MNRFAKIFIAVDLGMAAIVGAMWLYINSGPDTPDEGAAVPPPELHAVPLDVEGGPGLTSTELSLLLGAGVVIAACAVLWVVLGVLERRRAATYAFDAPAADPVSAPDESAQREAANLFRAAAQRPDQPAFGRAPPRAGNA